MKPRAQTEKGGAIKVVENTLAYNIVHSLTPCNGHYLLNRSALCHYDPW